MFGTPVNTATYRQINIGQLRHVLRQYGPASRRFLALPGVGDDDGMVEQQDSYANEVQDVAAGHDTATAIAHYAVGDELYYGLSETKDHALTPKLWDDITQMSLIYQGPLLLNLHPDPPPRLAPPPIPPLPPTNEAPSATALLTAQIVNNVESEVAFAVHSLVDAAFARLDRPPTPAAPARASDHSNGTFVSTHGVEPSTSMAGSPVAALLALRLVYGSHAKFRTSTQAQVSATRCTSRMILTHTRGGASA